MSVIRTALAGAAIVLLLTTPSWAQRDMDYGSFLTGSLDRDPEVSAENKNVSTEQDGDPSNHIAAKAINVRTGGGTVTFDTDLVRYAIAWTDGFLNLVDTHMTTGKG